MEKKKIGFANEKVKWNFTVVKELFNDDESI
mgnify:CR=1 FL=1